MLLFLLTDNNFRNITLPNAANIFRLADKKPPSKLFGLKLSRQKRSY